MRANNSADGRIIYSEGRDFRDVRDPKLGMDPWPGGFTAWHKPPVVTVPPGSRIRDGQTVLLGYFHTSLIYEEQVMCCMAEPKVEEILRWQIAQVHKHLQPDSYFLQHDEIRVQGWDDSCRRSGKTPGELLAENVGKCAKLVRAEDPGKSIYVWSDMFDPSHNAVPTGRYYLVKGDGPWYGSWKGLDNDVVIVNWNSDPAKRAASLRHFASQGKRQILAGYYDVPVDAIAGWLRDGRQVSGVDGRDVHDVAESVPRLGRLRDPVEGIEQEPLVQKRILKTSRLVLREMSQDDLTPVAKMLRRIIETLLASSF